MAVLTSTEIDQRMDALVARVLAGRVSETPAQRAARYEREHAGAREAEIAYRDGGWPCVGAGGCGWTGWNCNCPLPGDEAHVRALKESKIEEFTQ